MAAGGIGKSAMAATYSVEVSGFERTKAELAKLDGAIRALRGGSYSSVTSTTVASSLGSKDLFVSKIEQVEGRVQTRVEKMMIAAMDRGVEYQRFVLDRTISSYGKKRFARGQGGSAGRNDTGAMIDAVTRGVESFKSAASSVYTGYHGWKQNRQKYFAIQEKGFGVNSLGSSIPSVREFLKAQLATLKGGLK